MDRKDTNISTSDILVADLKRVGQSHEAMRRIQAIRDDEFRYELGLRRARVLVAVAGLAFAGAVGYLVWSRYV